MSEYVNIHGDALRVSARDAVVVIEPRAYLIFRKVRWFGRKRPEALLQVHVARADGKARNGDRLIGEGATEESAWRNTWSRMLADDVARGAKA